MTEQPTPPVLRPKSSQCLGRGTPGSSHQLGALPAGKALTEKQGASKSAALAGSAAQCPLTAALPSKLLHHLARLVLFTMLFGSGSLLVPTDSVLAHSLAQTSLTASRLSGCASERVTNLSPPRNPPSDLVLKGQAARRVPPRSAYERPIQTGFKRTTEYEVAAMEVAARKVFELNISEQIDSESAPIARSRAFTLCTTQISAASEPSLKPQDPATPSPQPSAPAAAPANAPSNSSTTARPSPLPAGVVIVRLQQRPWGERNSPSEPANAINFPSNSPDNSPASIDSFSTTPLFVDRIVWGLVIDRESQSVVIPAALLSQRESLDILVSGISHSATWHQVLYEVDAIDSWAGWAILQPQTSPSSETETENADAQTPVFAVAQLAPTSEIGQARAIDETVWALPEPQHWLSQQSDETPLPARWQDRWQGVGPKSDAALDEGDRWIDFGGMQAIQVPNEAGTGPLFDRQGACVGWLLNILPASDEIGTEAASTPASTPPTSPPPDSTPRATPPLATTPHASTRWAQVIDRSLMRIWDELRQSIAPRFGFLGIRPRQPRERVLARGFRGVSVYDVPPATPASQLGLAYGDLITHWNGRSVEQPATLLWLIAAQEPGSSVEVTWVRGVLTDRPETRVQSVTLSRRPLSNNLARFRQRPALRHAIEVDWSTAAPNFAAVADQLPEGQAVWIAAVANPPTLDASLVPGTWITTIQGVPARNPEDFWEQVSAGPDQLELQLWLPGQRETVLVKVERDALLARPSP